MKKRFHIPFGIRAVAVVLVLTLALGYMIGERIKILTQGTEIVLRTKPVDPRDLFRGHYARLRFDISDVPKPHPKPKRNTTVFIRLKPAEDGFWQAVSTHLDFPKEQPGTVIIKGTVKNNYASTLAVRYGIERYFAPKAKALALEDLNNKAAPVGVIVRISTSGEAAISGLMIDGKKVYEEPLF